MKAKKSRRSVASRDVHGFQKCLPRRQIYLRERIPCAFIRNEERCHVAVKDKATCTYTDIVNIGRFHKFVPPLS